MTTQSEIKNVDNARAKALEDLLNSRFSCRELLSDPVPRPVIETLLGLAQKSAS